MSKYKRQKISKKLRFEVFKRDSFTCQYCGRSAPDVILEVDHIKPVKEGGTNTLDNLITACKECNAGKGPRLLDDRTIIQQQRQQLNELNERREQLKMMMQWREELFKLDEEKLSFIQKRFEERALCALTNASIEQLRKLIKKYPLEMISDAIESATDQYLIPEGDGYSPESITTAFKAIPKICGVKLASQEKPYLQDLLYIRAILRNRVTYYDKHKALLLLEQAYKEGATIESLASFTKSVRSWSEWRGGLTRFIFMQQEKARQEVGFVEQEAIYQRLNIT